MRCSLAALLLVMSLLVQAETLDSLRAEKRGDQWFVIHQVDAGETLYAIARRYQADVSKIIKQNNIQNNNIQLGQTLEIPVTLNRPVTTTPPKTEIKTHVVATGETLYALSRKYGVKVEEIVAWNSLATESLSVGQELKIGGKATIALPREVKSPDPVRPNPSIEERITASETFGKIVEEGVAMQIDEIEDTEKYLALHKSLPIGTLVEVRNLMNNKKVFVRVIGQLPETGNNDNVIIRLTPKSFKQLGILDLRARVELTYYDE